MWLYRVEKAKVRTFPFTEILLFNLDFDDSYIEKYKRGKRVFLSSSSMYSRLIINPTTMQLSFISNQLNAWENKKIIKFRSFFCLMFPDLTDFFSAARAFALIILFFFLIVFLFVVYCLCCMLRRNILETAKSQPPIGTVWWTTILR